MTVKLLCDWTDSRNGKNYKANNLLTTDAGTESGLVAAKIAETNLAGGTAYVAPVPERQRFPVFVEVDVTGGSVNIVLSSTAPVNADGRPDGTIHIQTV